MDRSKFVFAGNRFFVLEEMMGKGLDIVRIIAVKNSYLEKILVEKKIAHVTVENKKQVIAIIEEIEFDYFIANGLPYILPISELKKSNQKQFINIHPSFLPDLRGSDPVPGALLYGKNSGATCHFMNDLVDAGDIIEQVEIKYSGCLDAGLLYQLTFMAEKEVFLKSLQRNFSVLKKQTDAFNDIYYTLKKDDLLIDFSETAENIIRKVKAFNTVSQGAYFNFENECIKVYDAEIVNNEYLLMRINEYPENMVVFNYEKKILIKKQNYFLKLKQLTGDTGRIIKGAILK